MNAHDFVARLDGARKVGVGRWRARCPAHDGRNPSTLSVGEASDGAVLVKCFHGCTVDAVVGALGIDLADLFPPRGWQADGVHHVAPKRPRTDWPALIAACERDLLLVKVALGYVARREPINDADAKAAQAAASRVFALIQEARDG